MCWEMFSTAMHNTHNKSRLLWPLLLNAIAQRLQICLQIAMNEEKKMHQEFHMIGGQYVFFFA